MEILLAYTTDALMLQTAFTGCVSLGKFVIFLLVMGVEQESQDERLKEPKSFPRLSGQCVNRCPWGSLGDIAQSANRARLNRQSRLRHSLEMTDRGPPVVLLSRSRNVLTGHFLYVENIDIVNDRVS